VFPKKVCGKVQTVNVIMSDLVGILEGNILISGGFKVQRRRIKFSPYSAS
jgi:hypothetical protein